MKTVRKAQAEHLLRAPYGTAHVNRAIIPILVLYGSDRDIGYGLGV